MHSSLYLIAGLGKTGHSIARFLKRRNLSFVAFDTRVSPSGLADFNHEFPDVDVFSESVPETLYKQLTAIISSPGVALDHPVMQHAKQMGLPIFGDIECLAREVKVPVIAITGTNGKSTVTTLVGDMAKASGFLVAVAGNIGTPVLDLLDNDIHYDLWVLELSSFQLDLTYSLAPIAATILNVSPDHLDRHHSLQDYILAKQRIYNQAQCVLFNREDEHSYPMTVSDGASVMSFGLDAPADNMFGILTHESQQFLACGEHRFMLVDEIKVKGRHNWANALAACALAKAAGIATPYMTQVLKHFSGLPHRSQWVRTLDGVEWINDSKGTNIGATISAISGIGHAMPTGKIVLIAGGQGKGADFNELKPAMTQHVRTVVLIGEDADLIEQALMDVVPILRAIALEDAIKIAKDQAQAGDVVLLSPACASLDMFRDFNHRGEVYTAVVNML